MAILLIGCGRMGQALVRCWGDRETVLVFDPAADLPEGVERVETMEDVPWDDELVVFLAVKPQMLPAVAQSLGPLVRRGPLIVSIMAGVTLAKLRDALGGANRVVRGDAEHAGGGREGDLGRNRGGGHGRCRSPARRRPALRAG